jgi:hypothetical protein
MRARRQRGDRHRPQQLDGQARDQHRLAALDLLGETRQQRRRGAAVLRLPRPRSARQLGGDESFAVPNEEGFGRHAVDG